MGLTDYEAKQIADRIGPIFHLHLNSYDFGKYPPSDYARYKTTFAAKSIENPEIHGSLVWKWGHFGKDNFPFHQQELIAKVASLWPVYVGSRAEQTAETTFNWWRIELPATAYITAAYITHLIHHADPLPIIDQHNFRAMNDLMKAVRSDHEGKKLPRNWTDLANLKTFMLAVLKHLPKEHSFGELDRFLMMYGRSIKPRKIKKP